MLTAISSTVFEPISTPIGAWTLAHVSAVAQPLSRNSQCRISIFRLLPIRPI